jgi:hypothetical protein
VDAESKHKGIIMRASEFIFEVKAGKISKRSQESSRGINTYGDAERTNSDYVGFKLGQAMAMADGSGSRLDIDPKSWHGKKKTVHPYSEIEQKMFNQGAKAVGASAQDINHGDMKSKELSATNSVSPVNNWNKKSTSESASVGATSSASVGANTAISPSARSKKKKNGTTVNALNGDSIFERPVKR